MLSFPPDNATTWRPAVSVRGSDKARARGSVVFMGVSGCGRVSASCCQISVALSGVRSIQTRPSASVDAVAIALRPETLRLGGMASMVTGQPGRSASSLLAWISAILRVSASRLTVTWQGMSPNSEGRSWVASKTVGWLSSVPELSEGDLAWA